MALARATQSRQRALDEHCFVTTPITTAYFEAEEAAVGVADTYDSQAVYILNKTAHARTHGMHIGATHKTHQSN